MSDVYCASCGKIQYETERAAHNAARRQSTSSRKSTNIKWEPYRCRDSGKWHLTGHQQLIPGRKLRR